VAEGVIGMRGPGEAFGDLGGLGDAEGEDEQQPEGPGRAAEAIAASRRVRVLLVRRGAAAALRASAPEVHGALQRARAASAVQALVEAAGSAPGFVAEAEMVAALEVERERRRGG